ncbi:MAG: M48 family metallopeptidase [Candidatus Heimdallarchaeaceae archaeon]
MPNESSEYDVDTSETLIRILVLTFVIFGWFGEGCFRTIYRVSIGELSWQNWLDFITTFNYNYSIFLVLILSYVLSNYIIERKMKLLPLPSEYSYVKGIVDNASRLMNLKFHPKIQFLDVPEPYAFTYGRRSKEAKIVLSKGLIKNLDEEELKVVILHELSHIKNRDLVFMTWGTCLLKALKYWVVFLFINAFVALVRYFIELSPSSILQVYCRDLFLTIVFMIMIFYVVPLLVINSVSRIRELLADTLVCKFTRVEKLEKTLKKIYRIAFLSKVERVLVPRLSILSFSSTLTKNKLFKYLLATHPSIKERIRTVKERRYVKSWENACKIDRKAIYVGIMAFVIMVIGFDMGYTIELITNSKLPEDYTRFLFLLPIPFIFWINSLQPFQVVSHIPRKAFIKRLLGTFNIIVKNLISLITASLCFILFSLFMTGNLLIQIFLPYFLVFLFLSFFFVMIMILVV